MSYIGNTATQQAYVAAVDYFSGNASTTAFTLSRPVASVTQMIVVIDNVPQNPSTAFTVSGNTITFTSAPLSGSNNIWVQYTSPITQVISPSQGTVNPTSIDNNYTLWNLSGTIAYYSGGNVGIGTSSPSSLLTVAGSSSLGTASASGNTSIYQAPGSLYLTLNTNGTLGGSRRNWSISPEYDAAGALSFMVGASEGASPTSTKMVITSAGFVGIGTASPNYLLDVRPATGLTGAGIELFRGSTSGTGGVLNFRPSLGTSASDIYNLSITSYDHSGDSNTDGLSLNGYDGVSFCTGSNSRQERMRIDVNGFVSIATTPFSGTALTIKAPGTGNQYMVYGLNGGNTNTIRIQGDGSIYNYYGTYGTISDANLKENIVDASPKLDDLMQVKIRNYNLISDESKTKQLGVVAQELETIFPNMVTEDEDGNKAVKSAVFVPMLIKAIQELKAEVDALKAGK